MLYGYEIKPRDAALGGGWKLTLLVDGEEAGGGVFPVNRDADPHAGMVWFNALSERERAQWLERAASAVPADAWGAYLSAEAHADAQNQGEAWAARNDPHQ